MERSSKYDGIFVSAFLVGLSALIFGLFGEKKSKKERKRELLERNKAKGKAAEKQFEFWQRVWGNEVTRAPHGQDYIVKKRDIWTGKNKTIRVEIKSGKTAKLSKKQLETKKKHRNYEEKRIDPIFY